MDMRMARSLPERRSSTYLYVTDESGDMHVGISDMDIVESVSPEWLSQHIARINRADAVVIDANLPEASIAYLAANCTAPMIADPVSTVKALRLKSILPRLRAIKPNALEASILSREEIHSDADVERAADRLLQMGVHRLFLSLGSRGVYAAMGKERLWLNNLPGSMVNTTGCGDAFMAALVWAYLEGMNLKDTALSGLAAAAIAMESPETINPAMSAEAIKARTRI